MIEIIKHGRPRDKVTCNCCSCIFSFDERDIQNNGCQYDWIEYIKCPDCGNKIILHRGSPFKAKRPYE